MDRCKRILKPAHQGNDYPDSVVNEYFVMRLAKAVGMDVPQVYRHYCPQPVYIVERFDRVHESGAVMRRHMIDTCQLLNKARAFKYQQASVATLQDVLPHIRVKAAARQRLLQWLIFNVLVGNEDNHLKNISFMVSSAGVTVAPGYDLLSTAAYKTKALSPDKNAWPAVGMAMSLPGAATYAGITRDVMLDAGRMLGLKDDTIRREMHRMTQAIIPAADALIAEIEAENAAFMAAHPTLNFGRELRLLRAIRHIVIAEMVGRLS